MPFYYKPAIAEVINVLRMDAQEVKHGRWVDDYNAEENPFFRKGWKCTACGFRTSYGKPKFCMNCGARMDGESNE